MRDQYERCYLTGTVDGKLISLKGSLHLVEPLGDMRFLIDASEMVKAAAATRIEASLPVSITRSVSGERLDATAVRVSMECIVLDDNYLLEVGERLTLTLRIPDGDVTITPRGTVGVTEAGETLVNIDRECADAAAALAAHVLRVSREQLHRRRRGAAASEPDF